MTLPVAAWAFGRLARMRFPGPACLAAATVPYLFGREFTIYGGNIASTMAGEFCFSISLSLALVFLGLVARGLETGRNRALAAFVLAGVGLCHILPLFFAVGGAIVMTLMRFDANNLKAFRKRVLQWTLPVLVVGGALIAFWALPFELRLPYATDMGYEKITTYLVEPLPRQGRLAVHPGRDRGAPLRAPVQPRRHVSRDHDGPVGVWCSGSPRRPGSGTLGCSRSGSCASTCSPAWRSPRSGCWSSTEYETDAGRPWTTTIPIPVVTVLVALVWVNYPLHNLPFGHTNAVGQVQLARDQELRTRRSSHPGCTGTTRAIRTPARRARRSTSRSSTR